MIESLLNEQEQWVTDQTLLKDLTIKYSTDLFKFDPHGKGDFILGGFLHFSEESIQELDRDFKEEEVLNSVKGMNSLKAPGPDGYQAFFYQQVWDVVGPTVITFALQALNEKQMPKGSAEALLVLIPKIDHPCKISQYRPISLCNIAYKLVTKMIINHLKSVLGDLISPNHSSFIPGGQNVDNLVVCQEILHMMNQKKGL